MKEKNKEKTKNLDNDVNDSVFEHYDVYILTDNDVITYLKVDYNKKTFEHEGKQYTINNKYVYFLPFSHKKVSGYIPTLYYNKDNKTPINFENKNEGIPARVLYLLWDHSLYSVIVTFDTDRTNKLIIILLMACAIIFCIRLYFVHGA